MLFENIDESALRTKGSAGRSGLDLDGWKHISLSRNYGLVGKDLRDALLALFARKLCTEKNRNQTIMETTYKHTPLQDLYL